MKRKKIFNFGALSISMILSFAGCGKTNPTAEPTVEPTVEATGDKNEDDIIVVDKSDSLYVKKVENINDDFIMGMDASSVISLEKSGVKYYDYDGNEQDVFKTLAQSGVNYIRVRVWNNPFDESGNGYGGGNCDINTAVEIGNYRAEYGSVVKPRYFAHFGQMLVLLRKRVLTGSVKERISLFALVFRDHFFAAAAVAREGEARKARAFIEQAALDEGIYQSDETACVASRNGDAL